MKENTAFVQTKREQDPFGCTVLAAVTRIGTIGMINRAREEQRGAGVQPRKAADEHQAPQLETKDFHEARGLSAGWSQSGRC